MSDELRAACDRLRRCVAGESIYVVYDDKVRSGAASAGLMIDRAALADAYLAEHPADDGVAAPGGPAVECDADE